MITITLCWDAQAQRHYITGAVDGTAVYDSNDGIPSDIWDAARAVVRHALVNGRMLDARGDRHEFGDYAVVVERVQPHGDASRKGTR